MPNLMVGTIARIPAPSVDPTTPVRRIASIMAKQDVGAVIVAKDFEVLGIVTERDIINKVALAEKDLNEVVAQEIMTSPVVTITFERTIQEALRIMKQNGIRRLVVVKEGNIFGLVTERRALLTNFAQNASIKE